MFSTTLVLALSSAFLFVPASISQVNANDAGLQATALSTDTLHEASQLKVYALKQADCLELAELIASTYPELSVQAEWRTNTLIVQATPEELLELDELIDEVEPVEAAPLDAAIVSQVRIGPPEVTTQERQQERTSEDDVQLRLYHLKYADCEEFAEAAGSVLPEVSIQIDVRTNVAIVCATAEQLLELDGLFDSLERPGSVDADNAE